LPAAHKYLAIHNFSNGACYISRHFYSLSSYNSSIVDQRNILSFLVAAVVAFFPAQYFGQKKDYDKLAMQYFEQKEYEKANVYFESLFDGNPEAWHNYYFKSLLEVKDYYTAEKISKKLLKRNDRNVYLYVYLGKIYRLQGNQKKEKDQYDKAIKELMPVQPFIEGLAHAFAEEQLFDYALEVYNKGRKATPDYPYYYERAEVFKQKNDLRSMINEYLDAIEFRESELGTVQSHLQNSLGYDDDQGGMKNPLLRQELQKRIQKNPERTVFSEFLLFILKQQRDFDGAFVQARALDKRLKEEGYRVFELGKICAANQQWAAATRCFDYILELGPSNQYYDASFAENVNVQFQSVLEQGKPSQEELLKLEQTLLKADARFRSSPYGVTVMKNLATVQGLYLNKADVAITRLNEFINRPGIDNMVKAEVKLLLAEIYLVTGEIWEASLLNSQVEKQFKYEPIGQEAKFRNAKLSYFAGEFTWAKAQVDVLKGATTKLIANDALDLSLIITDAIGVDTNEVPLKMFASAELMALQHRYDEAIARMDSVNLLFSSNTLGDDIFFRKARICEKLGKLNDAEENYRNILKYYADEIYGDDAQFRLAELYERRLNKPEEAKLAYEQVLVKYPGSIFTVEARKRFRELRGDNLNN